jgi:beta-phosphoglucomutase
MPAISAVVFDFDGVLADSEPLHLRAYQEVLSEIGITLSRDEYYAHYLGFDDVGAFKAMGRAHGRDWDEHQIGALVARKIRVFDQVLASTDVLYPAAVPCVERLARRFALGIASGALRHEIEAVLRRTRLDRYFRFVVASGDTRHSKPAPDPYLRAAELHAVSSTSCVAIEDSRWGIASAQGAGMRCVGITHTYPAQELAAADAVIDSLNDFTAELIQSLRTAEA